MSETTIKEIIEIEKVLGLDCGNHSTEVAAENENGEVIYYTQPTTISSLALPPQKTENELFNSVENIFDNLIVHFKNDELKISGYYAIGDAALRSNGTLRNMPITNSNKSGSDIPIITGATMLAAEGLKGHVVTSKNKKRVVPAEISMKVSLVTAIPSSEYSLDKAEKMEKRFVGTHKITFYLGSGQVDVTLEIVACKVTEEGKTSMLTFFNSGDDILEKYNKQYDLTAKVEDFAEAEILHCDIGDGTTEFTFTVGPNPVASDGIVAGVGHVTNLAMEIYKDRLGGFVGEMKRQGFMDILHGSKSRTPLAQEAFNTSLKSQSDLMYDEIVSQFITLTKSTAEYIAVHGGGSCVFEEHLYEKLVEFAKTVHSKVIYIPCKYATHMNSRGTLELAKVMYQNN